MSELAPIAVFAYKRASHLQEVFKSLSQCPQASQSHLYVFCDGPKNTDSYEQLKQVRELAKNQKWCKKLEVIEKEKNLGLSKSITSGVTEVVNLHNKIIVLEDDQIVAPSFLEFNNKALELYKDQERVMQITGYMYPIKTTGPNDAFFICHSSCWGWATWKRAWKNFNGSADKNYYLQLKSNSLLRKNFDMNHCYPYFQMLEQNILGKNDSWGINWYLELFKANGLILMPRHSLVKNIGRDDASATHKGKEVFADELSLLPIKSFPNEVKQDVEALNTIASFLRKKHVPLYKTILNRIKDHLI